MPDYPSIDPTSLVQFRVIASELDQDQGYLDLPDCPYDDNLKIFLRRLAPNQVESADVQGTSFLGKHGNKWEVLENESADLYKQLKDFREKLSVGDVAEQMSFFRTATSLLEKIITINERAMGLKHIHEFQEGVLQVIEEVLSTSQRTTVMARLRALIDGNDEPTPEVSQ